MLSEPPSVVTQARSAAGAARRDGEPRPARKRAARPRSDDASDVTSDLLRVTPLVTLRNCESERPWRSNS